MDVATQIVFIGYMLLITSAGFTFVGKPSQSDNLRSGFAILAFLYGIFTIAFLIWWDPANLSESIARWLTIGLLWVPFLVDLPKINRKPQVVTVGAALQSAVLNAIRVGLVLAFWVL